MLRTFIGATFAASWITLSPGCTMPTQPANLFSRVAESSDDDNSAEERNSGRTEDLLPAGSEADTTYASYADPGSQQAPGLDSATLYLIESELRDLPAAERQRWMAYLQTIDPQTVPYVLQARRMTVDSTPDVQQDPQTARAFQLPYQRPVAGSSDPRYSAGAGGAMSRMHLDAPEPAGASTATTPFTVQPQQQIQPGPEYVYDRNDAGMSVTTSNHEAQAQLPRISPGTYERVPGTEMNGDVVTTNFESTIDSPLQPMSSGQDAYLQEALQRVIALTEAEVAASNPGYTEQERVDYVKRHVALRMLHFMSEQPHRAQQAIPDVEVAEQEFWTGLFWSVSNYFDVTATPNPAERAARAASQLAAASRHLQHQAELELWNASFCHTISSFGNFEHYDRDQFRAGQPVLLYAELRNFHSEPTNTGHFRTQLKSHIEIRRGGIDGERIEYNSFPPTEDLCRAPRNDYFHSYKIDLPHHLTPGPHALVLTVEDMLSGKVATEVLDFVVQ